MKSLKDALSFSPENVVLRRQYGRILMERGQLEEAERVLREGLELSSQSEHLQEALAECYGKRGNTSAALAIVESLIKRADCAVSLFILYARLLLAEGQIEEAGRAYARATESDASLADADLARALGVPVTPTETYWDDDEDDVNEEGRMCQRGGDANTDGFVEMEKPDINFQDVGGMDDLKDQVRLKIIEPLKNPDIYAAYGKAIGGSILMYGPPGCGKTYLARATAGEVDAGFVSIGLHDVLDMYIGNSEQRLHGLFEFAREESPCIMFFDEVDALGASRSDMRQSGGRHLINQFLSELDGVSSSNEGLLILAATNAPWHIDPAFRRPGRFDRLLFVPPPDEPARAKILELLLRGKPLSEVDHEAVARKTEKCSGADLKAIVDQTIEAKLADALKQGMPSPISTKDLLKTAKAVKPSTAQWFASAKNYALYANEGGHYNEILDYLNMR